MDIRTYYYARVSTANQSLLRQIEEFKKLGATDRDIVTDKESGATLERNGYLALKNTILRSGDTLVVSSLDRLSRTKEDIKNELQYYKDKKIRVKVLDLPTTMLDLPNGQDWVFDMVNSILIEVLGTIAERERITIKARQRAGIEASKKRGKVVFGRPSIQKPENWDSVFISWKKNMITAKKAMELTNLKRTSFYKLVKDTLQCETMRIN